MLMVTGYRAGHIDKRKKRREADFGTAFSRPVFLRSID
jgi:hypothetical protein